MVYLCGLCFGVKLFMMGAWGRFRSDASLRPILSNSTHRLLQGLPHGRARVGPLHLLEQPVQLPFLAPLIPIPLCRQPRDAAAGSSPEVLGVEGGGVGRGVWCGLFCLFIDDRLRGDVRSRRCCCCDSLKTYRTIESFDDDEDDGQAGRKAVAGSINRSIREARRGRSSMVQLLWRGGMIVRASADEAPVLVVVGRFWFRGLFREGHFIDFTFQMIPSDWKQRAGCCVRLHKYTHRKNYPGYHLATSPPPPVFFARSLTNGRRPTAAAGRSRSILAPAFI